MSAAAARGWALLNPDAGSCQDPDEWRQRLTSAGYEVRVPASAAEARTLAAAAAEAGAETVVAAGGDGSVHHAANALLAGPTPRPRLGILPLGTANDYARSLGLPRDPREALDLLTDDGPAPAVDVIEIRHDGPGGTAAGGGSGEASKARYCLNVAVGGFGGEVARELDQEEKRHWGSLAYLRSAVQELSQLPRFRTRIEVDGEERRDTLVNVVVANGRYTGGGVPVAPRGRVDDGRLRLLLVPTLELGELGRLASRLLAGEHGGRGSVLEEVRSVTVVSDPPMHFRADGEPVGSSPVTMEVRPGALAVIRPAEGSTA